MQTNSERFFFLHVFFVLSKFKQQSQTEEHLRMFFSYNFIYDFRLRVLHLIKWEIDDDIFSHSVFIEKKKQKSIRIISNILSRFYIACDVATFNNDNVNHKCIHRKLIKRSIKRYGAFDFSIRIVWNEYVYMYITYYTYFNSCQAAGSSKL